MLNSANAATACSFNCAGVTVKLDTHAHSNTTRTLTGLQRLGLRCRPCTDLRQSLPSLLRAIWASDVNAIYT